MSPFLPSRTPLELSSHHRSCSCPIFWIFFIFYYYFFTVLPLQLLCGNLRSRLLPLLDPLLSPRLSTSRLPPLHHPLPLPLTRSGLSHLFLSEPMSVLLESNSALTHASLVRHSLNAVRLVATVRPTFTSPKVSVGFVRFMGVSPFSHHQPPPPPQPHPLITGSCWEMQIYGYLPYSITTVWHPLMKHKLYYQLSLWLHYHGFIQQNVPLNIFTPFI